MTAKRQLKPVNHSFIPVLGAYYVTIGLLLIFSLHPIGRLWGVNLLATFPTTVIYMLIPVLCVLPAAVFYGTGKLLSDVPGKRERETAGYLWFATGLIVLSVVVFYLFRARTHFDGDGYTLLSNLTSTQPIIKYRNFGAVAAQFALYSALGKGGEATALTVYQIISYSAGVMFLIVALLAARVLYSSLIERILFVTGTAMGGYSLQFFGYVENYALFIVTVFIYLLAGLLIIRKNFPRWVIVFMNLLALTFHVFGVVLVPASIYILIHKTKLATWIDSKPVQVKAIVTLTIIVPIAATFFYLFYSDYFFRFAFLPLMTDRFTASGYTVFSFKHLSDIANLLIILCPGLLVLVTALLVRRSVKPVRSEILRFLALAAGCSLAAVLVFDPKLGMPRDWDLFAFAGLPLSILLYELVLGQVDAHHPQRSYFAVAISVVLGFIFLAVSVAIRVTPEAAVNRFKSYAATDVIRNRNNGYFISLYYRQQSDSARAQEEYDHWLTGLTDDSTLTIAAMLVQQGRVDEGLAMARRISRRNPFFSPAYNLCIPFFIQQNMLDSARIYLRISLGLQPNFWIYWYNLGIVEQKMGNAREAEKCWLRAMKGDSTFLDPLLYLLRMYRLEGRSDDYLSCLVDLSKRPGAPADQLVELVRLYCKSGSFELARGVLGKARANGLDSTEYDQLVSQYPTLRRAP